MKKQFIGFVMWPVDQAKIKAFADMSGLSQSAVVRNFIRLGMQEAQLNPIQEFKDKYFKLEAEACAEQAIQNLHPERPYSMTSAELHGK
jgi:hypothetical protein